MTLFATPSTSADWTAYMAARVDRLAARLDELHGTLHVPDGAPVTIAAYEVWGEARLAIHVGTRRQYRLTAVLTLGGGLELVDTTATDCHLHPVALGKVGLRRNSTAQNVVDALVTHVANQNGTRT